MHLAALLLPTVRHDAPRKNPFDPELTPPVELSVALRKSWGYALRSSTTLDNISQIGVRRRPQPRVTM